MDNNYLCWLMNQLQIAGGGGNGYLRLCEVLQTHAFAVYVTMDENRIDDVFELREEAGPDIQADYFPPFLCTCSMLELLVVLVRRMNYELLDSQYESPIGRWTMELLQNAGLDIFINDRFKADENAENEVRMILENIVMHTYGFDGEGSFFPLRYSPNDQRGAELLTQMNNYIAENYDIC